MKTNNTPEKGQQTDNRRKMFELTEAKQKMVEDIEVQKSKIEESLLQKLIIEAADYRLKELITVTTDLKQLHRLAQCINVMNPSLIEVQHDYFVLQKKHVSMEEQLLLIKDEINLLTIEATK